ncbi:MAG: alpha/beta hydrolase [Actinomycetota bacterium]
MIRKPVQFQVQGARLSANRWEGTGAPVVLLHAGVADRRSWYSTADQLVGVGTVVAYDRRGFGDSPPSQVPFEHLDDLITVLDQLGEGPAWLVGSSNGGKVALDAALAHPDRVAGLVLLAPAISGAPAPEGLDAMTQQLGDQLDVAAGAGDAQEVNRLETWLWLDGPASHEGRVSGAARELALTMNAVILGNEVPDDAGTSNIDAWRHLEQIQATTTVAWGDLDVPFMIQRSEVLTTRLPHVRRQVIPGTAHLPYLERPALIANLIQVAVGGG